MEKYYTPELSEIHIGFEFENLGYISGADEPKWHKSVFDWRFADLLQFNPEQIEGVFRVKFLDREDIESEGWICTGGQMISGGTSTFEMFVGGQKKENKWQLRFEKTLRIWIRQGGHTRFLGHIKNISELRKIQKMLGIK